MQQLQTELALSVRRLLTAPGFTAFAVITLALGIGATTAIYSVIYTALLRPPGIRDVDRVVNIYHADPSLSSPMASLSFPDYEDLRRAQTSFSSIAPWVRFRQPVFAEGNSDYLIGEMVGGEYFQMLGVAAAMGRTIQPADDKPGAPAVAVISDELWRRRFGADPAAIGKTLKVGSVPFEVIGVAPPTFRGVDMPNVIPTPIWIPLNSVATIEPTRLEDAQSRERRWVRAKARLRPGVSVQQAASEVLSIGRALDASNPIGTTMGAKFRMPPHVRRDWLVIPAAQILAHESIHQVAGPMASTTMAAVVLVLLVTCTNLANLLLARGAVHRHDIAVRLALGASRWHLVRQLTIESALIALLGGAGAFIIARAAMLALSSSIRVGTIVLQFEPVLHSSVLAVCVAATLLALLVFGLLPAIHATRADVRQLLANDEGNTAAPRWRTRRFLIAGQVGVSVLLVAVAALCVEQIAAAAKQNLGFSPDRLALASMDFGAQRIDETRGRQLLDSILEAARRLPGVQSAALSSGLPIRSSAANTWVGTPDRPISASWFGHPVELVAATPDIFRTLGVPILRARRFTDQENAANGSPSVVVITEAVAAALYPNRDPIGHQITVRYDSYPGEPQRPAETRTIIGVAGNTDTGTSRPSAAMYVPFGQHYELRMSVIVRAERPADLLPALRATVAKVDPEIALTELGTGSAIVGSGIMLKVMAGTAGMLGTLALVLAMVGLYGVLSHLVARRTREMGIRMALGADRARIMRMMIGDGFRPVALGIVAGLGFGALARAAMRPIFVRMLPAMDAGALIAVPLLFIAFAVVACYFPARRAARVDPSVALRNL
jgi:predicted permease